MHAAKETAGAFGAGIKQKFVRSLENAQPINALGRLTTGAIGAATFGTLGLASGIASGDFKNSVQNTIAAGAGGFKLGSGAFDTASNALSVEGLDEVAEKAYLGEDKYREAVAKRNQMKKAHQEDTIRKIQEKYKLSRKEAAEKAEKLAQKYMEHKLDDVNDWIAAEEMQKQIAIDKNGKKLGRKYSEKEAIATAKLNNEIGFKGKKEEDIKKQMKTINPNLDADVAFQALRVFNNEKK